MPAAMFTPQVPEQIPATVAVMTAPVLLIVFDANEALAVVGRDVLAVVGRDVEVRSGGHACRGGETPAAELRI